MPSCPVRPDTSHHAWIQSVWTRLSHSLTSMPLHMLQICMLPAKTYILSTAWYFLAVISNVGRTLLVFVSRWGISDSSSQNKLHVEPKDPKMLSNFHYPKICSPILIAAATKPQISTAYSWILLRFMGFASVHMFQYASTCFKVSRKFDHNPQLQ